MILSVRFYNLLAEISYSRSALAGQTLRCGKQCSHWVKRDTAVPFQYSDYYSCIVHLTSAAQHDCRHLSHTYCTSHLHVPFTAASP